MSESADLATALEGAAFARGRQAGESRCADVSGGDSTEFAKERPDDLDENLTERLLVAAARIGQHRFAHQVLDNHGHRCVFCGLRLPAHNTAGRRLLTASHIKPWRASTNSERLDHRNGLAACPTHDAAFDSGLLAVNGRLRIHIAPHIQRFATTDRAAAAAFDRPPLAERLILPAGADPPLRRYLD